MASGAPIIPYGGYPPPQGSGYPPPAGNAQPQSLSYPQAPQGPPPQGGGRPLPAPGQYGPPPAGSYPPPGGNQPGPALGSAMAPGPQVGAGTYSNPGSKPPATVLSAQTSQGATHSFTVEERRSFAEHLNQVLSQDPHLKDRLPMNPSDDSLFNVIADGVLLCKYINKVKPGSIPENKIVVRPNKTPFDINNNHTLALEAARLLGFSIVNIGPSDLAAGPKAAHLILGLLWQVIRMDLLNQVSLAKHPEMVALMAPTEDLKTFAFVAPEQNLLRWFNYHLRRANCPRQVSNFSSDIRDSECYTVLLNQLVPQQCSLEPLREQDPARRAELMLQMAGRIGCRKFVAPEDVVAGNSKLNLAFVAYLFNQYPGLEAREQEDAEMRRRREAELQEALAMKAKAEEEARRALVAAENTRREEEQRRQAWMAEEAARKAKWEQDEAARKAKWDQEEAMRLQQLQELDRRKAQLDAEHAQQLQWQKAQQDARLAAEAEARLRAVEAEENARRQRLLEEEANKRRQWEAEEQARRAAREAEEQRRWAEEEQRRAAQAAYEAEQRRLEDERRKAEDYAAWQLQQQLLQQQAEAAAQAAAAQQAAALAQQQVADAMYQQQLLQQQQQQQQALYDQQQAALYEQQQAALYAQQQAALYAQQQQTTYYSQPQQYTYTTTTQYMPAPPPPQTTTVVTTMQYAGGFPIPRLFITVMEAHHLVKKDMMGLMKSDPYCVIEGKGRRYQTVPCKSTQNPVWHETFEFNNVLASDDIHVSVWDYDHIGRHNFMGECRVTYQDMIAQQKWLHLGSRPGHHDRVAGEIQLRIQPSG